MQGNHDNFKSKAKRLVKKAIRKEVKDICKTITKDLDRVCLDDFFQDTFVKI